MKPFHAFKMNSFLLGTRFFSSLLLLLMAFSSFGQNPASPPLDSSLSLPERSFDVLWQTFEDHYAFFKLRNVDWKASYEKYRPMVNAHTSEDSLFSILSQMITPFQDDHINLIIPGKKQFKSRKPSFFNSQFPDPKAKAQFWTMVDTDLAKHGFQLQAAGPEFRGKPLFYFGYSKGIGYLRFSRCFASDDSEDEAQDAEVAGKLLDSILVSFQPLKTLVIDVRSNIGGNDEFSYAIANRFTQQKQLGHYKTVRKGGYESFGPPKNYYLEPQGSKPIILPTYVLTNDQTASAADVFAMIMKTLPQTKLVGDHTLGIYSDMYGFELPNKWLVSLSNERYFSNKGVCYEGKGTPVDIPVKTTRQDAVKKVDPVLETVLKRVK